MKRKRIFFLCFMLLLNGLWVRPVRAEGLDVSAKAACLMERDSKRVLYQKNAQVKLPMASTTKIMTALLAVENCDLNQTLTVPPEASGIEGSSIWLSPGEKLTVEELLYGLMLSSGNDAAMTLALHMGGSVEGFAAMMNAKAKELGANDTNFVTPNGLHDENHYTTAYDLALISAYAMSNGDFQRIVGTKTKTIPWEAGQWDRSLKNKNKILWQYEGGNGVKTGYTSNAGKCLVSAANREDMQLIGVVLNCGDMFPESQRMLDYGFDHYEMMTLYDQEQSFGKMPVADGVLSQVEFVAEGTVRLPVTAEEKATVKADMKLDSGLTAPVKQGQEIGQVDVYIGENLISSMPVRATQDIYANTFGYNLKRVLDGWMVPAA